MSQHTPTFCTAVVFCIEGCIDWNPHTRTCYVQGHFDPIAGARAAYKALLALTECPSWEDSLSISRNEVEHVYVMRYFTVLDCGGAYFRLTEFNPNSLGY